MIGRVVLMTTAVGLALAAVASAARADALVDEAKAVVEKATARADKWDGPTSGPKAVAKKTVVYVAGDDGLVMAVSTEDRNPIWPIDQEHTPTQGMFNAMAPVRDRASMRNAPLGAVRIW